MSVANGYCPNIVTQDIDTSPQDNHEKINLDKNFDISIGVYLEVILDNYQSVNSSG